MNIDERDKKRLIEMIYSFTGIDMKDKSDLFFLTRLNKVMRDHEVTSLKELIEQCRENIHVREDFIDRVTTHETYFFRTHRIWSYLSNYLRDYDANEFSAWSAASSTGEEVYSLAILCEEYLSDEKKWSLFASDISAQAIEKAVKAQYQGRTMNKLKSYNDSYITKYFEKSDTIYQVADKIKDRVSFQQHSLFDDHKKDKSFDLVLLRNVIIYFSEEKIMQILDRIYHSLKPNGLLILGESEGLNDLHTGFESVDSFIYRKNAA